MIELNNGNFIVARTKAASKLNVIVYMNPTDPDDFYIQQRYKKIGDEIIVNWLNHKREILNYVPSVESYISVVGI